MHCARDLMLHSRPIKSIKEQRSENTHWLEKLYLSTVQVVKNKTKIEQQHFSARSMKL